MGPGHPHKEVQAWLQILTSGQGAGCGQGAPQDVFLCGVDDAVLKEHAGAITAHHGGVTHFEDDPCAL